jgi:hypothetical protein
MIGFLEITLALAGTVGVLAGAAVLTRSLMLSLFERRVHYQAEPVPAFEDRVGAGALAALSSLKELLVGLLPSRWPR